MTFGFLPFSKCLNKVMLIVIFRESCVFDVFYQFTETNNDICDIVWLLYFWFLFFALYFVQKTCDLHVLCSICFFKQKHFRLTKHFRIPATRPPNSLRARGWALQDSLGRRLSSYAGTSWFWIGTDSYRAASCNFEAHQISMDATLSWRQRRSDLRLRQWRGIWRTSHNSGNQWFRLHLQQHPSHCSGTVSLSGRQSDSTRMGSRWSRQMDRVAAGILGAGWGTSRWLTRRPGRSNGHRHQSPSNYSVAVDEDLQGGGDVTWSSARIQWCPGNVNGHERLPGQVQAVWGRNGVQFFRLLMKLESSHSLSSSLYFFRFLVL